MIDQDEELDMTTEEALLSALTPKRVGESKSELKPYSLGRQLLAGALCREIDDGYHTIIQTVWACTLEKPEAEEAMIDIKGSRLRAIDWAESQGYSVLYYQPLLDIWRQLQRELRASDARVRGGSADGDAPKNDGGPAVP